MEERYASLLKAYSECRNSGGRAELPHLQQDPQYGYGIHNGFTYVGQHESVNLGTGNLTIQIPLLKLPGRNGYDYSLSLTYNSQIWSGGEAITPQGFQNFFWQSVGSSPLGQTSLSYGWSESDAPQIYSDNVQVGTVGGQPVDCGNQLAHQVGRRPCDPLRRYRNRLQRPLDTGEQE